MTAEAGLGALWFAAALAALQLILAILALARPNEATESELIASVHGDCGADALETNRAAVTGTDVALLTNTDPAVAGPGYYLRLQASDLSLVEFTITLTHADGSADVAPIVRSTRVTNTGEYYLELSREIQVPLTGVSLTVPAGTTGTVDAQLCRAPAPGALAARGP